MFMGGVTLNTILNLTLNKNYLFEEKKDFIILFLKRMIIIKTAI